MNAQRPETLSFHHLKVSPPAIHKVHDPFNEFVDYLSHLTPSSLFDSATRQEIIKRFDSLEKEHGPDAFKLLEAKFGTHPNESARPETIIFTIVKEHKRVPSISSLKRINGW